MAFWTALRRWGERAIDAGVLTIDDIRKGDPAACTLLVGASSGTPVGEVLPPRLAPVAPRVNSGYATEQDLQRLMAQAIAMRRR